MGANGGIGRRPGCTIAGLMGTSFAAPAGGAPDVPAAARGSWPAADAVVSGAAAVASLCCSDCCMPRSKCSCPCCSCRCKCCMPLPATASWLAACILTSRSLASSCFLSCFCSDLMRCCCCFCCCFCLSTSAWRAGGRAGELDADRRTGDITASNPWSNMKQPRPLPPRPEACLAPSAGPRPVMA